MSAFSEKRQPFRSPRTPIAHVFKVLGQLPLADDQVIVADVIDTLTNFVEHPEVVADRLDRVAGTVGDLHRVLAGTDCGFDSTAGQGRVAEDVGAGGRRALGLGSIVLKKPPMKVHC